MYGKTNEGLKKLWQDPEFRKMRSESTKKQWQDPEYRKMMKEQWQDPEFRKMQSESNKGQNNPMSRENRAKRKAENFTDAVLPF
jgi:hypothetical protein